jgi:hypothetical protein
LQQKITGHYFCVLWVNFPITYCAHYFLLVRIFLFKKGSFLFEFNHFSYFPRLVKWRGVIDLRMVSSWPALSAWRSWPQLRRK